MATGQARQPVLLERAEELAALDAVIADTLAGFGRFAVVEGSAGIGKSSLLAEARLRASDAGSTSFTAVRLGRLGIAPHPRKPVTVGGVKHVVIRVAAERELVDHIPTAAARTAAKSSSSRIASFALLAPVLIATSDQR
jgi:hypothetical protein